MLCYVMLCVMLCYVHVMLCSLEVPQSWRPSLAALPRPSAITARLIRGSIEPRIRVCLLLLVDHLRFDGLLILAFLAFLILGGCGHPWALYLPLLHQHGDLRGSVCCVWLCAAWSVCCVVSCLLPEDTQSTSSLPASHRDLIAPEPWQGVWRVVLQEAVAAVLFNLKTIL